VPRSRSLGDKNGLWRCRNIKEIKDNVISNLNKINICLNINPDTLSCVAQNNIKMAEVMIAKV
jgi:hypothetical protein